MLTPIAIGADCYDKKDNKLNTLILRELNIIEYNY